MSGAQPCVEKKAEAAEKDHAPGLSMDDERGLIIAAQKGMEGAKSLLLKRNEWFIDRLSGTAYARLSFPRRRFEYDDIRQHVLIGFCRAIDAYDAARAGDARLTTYAWYYVRHELSAFARAESGLGRRILDRIRRVRAAADHLLMSGRSAGVEEIALFLKMPRKAVEEAVRLLAVAGAGDEPVADPQGKDPLQALDGETARKLLASAIGRLGNDDLAAFVRFRFYCGMEYGEIAEKMHCTVSRLKQMWHRAKLRLREDPGIRELTERSRGCDDE